MAFAVGFAGAAVMLPPKGRRDQDPIEMMTVSLPSLALAAVIVIVLACLPIPRAARGSQTGVGLALLLTVFPLFPCVLNLVRHSRLTEVVGAEAVAAWWVAVLALIAGTAVLLQRVRVPGKAAADSRGAATTRPNPRSRPRYRRRGDITSDLVNTPRLRGYELAMREMRLEPHIAHGNSLYESAPTALATLLAREPALTAIFALSDEMAAATVNELQRQGRRVPEDISVLGFDSTRTAVHVQPALTTVAQPLRKMGELAVERLLGTGPSTRVLDHRIVERGSVHGAVGDPHVTPRH